MNNFLPEEHCIVSSWKQQQSSLQQEEHQQDTHQVLDEKTRHDLIAISE